MGGYKDFAVLLTCFNRREKTIKCIKSVLQQYPTVSIYLVDDASTDGTSDFVKKNYPSVRIIGGSGDLFWNRGMYKAWISALENKYKYYLWLNDDVELFPGCLEELLFCASEFNDYAVVSGIVVSIKDGNVIYGGTDKIGNLLEPNGELQNIHNMNGNVVLVPERVRAAVGVLDPIFHHDLGDVDYGYRVRAAGYSVVTSRKAIARGYPNKFCRVRFFGGNVINRFKKLYSPLGSPPSINFYFRKKHKGVLNACLYYIFIHLLNLMPDRVVRFLFDKRYLNETY
jgi:GT2 family glycosyltransferase